MWKYLSHIKEELLIVLGTSSSESVLPRMMTKMEGLRMFEASSRFSHSDRILFQFRWNNDLFIHGYYIFSSSLSRRSSLGQQLTIIAILLVTSKGAAAVTGGGFIVLASTLSAMNVIPLEGLALLGVDVSCQKHVLSSI